MEIQVKIIADSVSKIGKRLTTYELIYPRIVHAELMTHGMLAKNAASSRAIPVRKVIELVRNTPAMPSRFGANQAGMQDKGVEHDAPINGYSPQEWWRLAALSAARFSEEFDNAGYHKQVCNRVTEPYQWMKTVVSGTEWANFFWLRDHKDADPTIAELARKMREAYDNTTPILLLPGDWHVPYYYEGYWKGDGDLLDVHSYTIEEALDISISCCAQVSYRTLDDSLEKAKRVVERLNLGESNDPKHSSPSEHQGTPMKEVGSWEKSKSAPRTGKEIVNALNYINSWEDGITAFHKELGFMSGKLAGWIQKRQLIKGNTKW